MGLVGKSLTVARSAAGMALGLTRATGRPDMALHYAVRSVLARHHAIPLSWRGLKLTARGIDWAAVEEILVEDEYGVLHAPLSARPTPVVLDIGANIGAFALFALSVAPNAVVHSFEPSARTFAILDANRALNPARHWHAHHAAAWRDDGSIAFSEGLSSTAGRVAATGKESVESLSLASILIRAGGRADVAKIDIEGAEEALLVGKPEDLARIETLVVELHPGRCDTAGVSRAIRESFGEVYAIPGRRSSKPLLFATRSADRPQLRIYRD